MTITGHFECLQYFSFKGTLAYFLRKMQTLRENKFSMQNFQGICFYFYELEQTGRFSNLH